MRNIFKRTKNPRIPLRTLSYMAWRNITSRKLRSFLTVFGVVIGVGSIAFLLSFGLGLQRIVTEQVVGDTSLKAIEVTSPNSNIIKLDAAAVNKIKQFPHIVRSGIQYSFPASISARGGEIDSVIYGVDQIYQELIPLVIISGRLLKNTDTNQVVVSSAALKSLGISDPEKAVGQELKTLIPLIGVKANKTEIKGDFTIVGVVDSGSNSELFIPSGLFDGAAVSNYKQAKIVVDEIDHVAAARKQIEGIGLQTTSPIDTLAQINQLFRFFNIILGSFGAIGMIVAVLGMLNTLTISLLERTKEIGLMITLGGRPKDMRRLFMYEALLLSLIGALAGLGLARLSGTVVNVFLNRAAASRTVESFDVFSMPSLLSLALVGFMLLIGFLVVYFPAKRAQRIDPIDALRRE